MVSFVVARGDEKSDEETGPKLRFPRIAASLSPLFALIGVLLFAGELGLGTLLEEPAEATTTITTLAASLGAASLLALLARVRQMGGPIPWAILAAVTALPAATGALLPGASPALHATGLWCSAWLNGALAWVAVIEVFATRTPRKQVGIAALPAALVLCATALCAAANATLLPLAFVAWALPAAHVGRPGDAMAEGALLCAPFFAAAALWLGNCAMIRAGVITEANTLVLAACGCLLFCFFVGIWVVRPRALVACLPLIAVVGAWSLFEGARAEAPEISVQIPSSQPPDDGQGLRVPYAPRN